MTLSYQRIVYLMMISGIWAMGCQPSSPATRSQGAVEDLKTARAQSDEIIVQVDRDLAALETLQHTEDLKGAFGKFVTEADKTSAAAQQIKSHVADMQERGAAYIAQWGEEMTTVTDPALKASAEQRRINLKANYVEIQDRYAAARDAYLKFTEDLDNIRTYLNNDLTPSGIKAIEGTAKQAKTDGEFLKAKATDVNAVLDAAAGTLSASKPK